MNQPFEEQLRRALKKVDPPDGFADRLMAQIPAAKPWARQRLWYGAIAAGLALLLTFSVLEQNRRVQRIRARETQRQVVFALTLAAEKLDRVNARLQKSAPQLRIEKERGQSL